MFKKYIIFPLFFVVASAHAGWFGGPSEEEQLAKRRMEEKNCAQEHSWAYCMLKAGGNLYSYQDVDLPEQAKDYVSSNGMLGPTANGALGVAVGTWQLNGSLPTPGGLSGLGAVSIAGGILSMFENPNAGMDDKTIGFLPMADAADGALAGKMFEQAYVDAFVKAIPGITHATVETIPVTGPGAGFVTTYVLHGGDCETQKCVLWSKAWGHHCKQEPCELNHPVLRLVENGFLGDGKYWTPHKTWIGVAINPQSQRDLSRTLAAPFPRIGGISNKLELMQKVSSHLPSWASYFLAPWLEKEVRYPVLLNGGNQYLLVKPKMKVSEAGNQAN